MKSKFPIRIVSFRLTASVTLLLLILSGGAFVRAQDTNAPAAAIDVSQFPTNAALLPGKGPSHFWSGLPKVWAERHAQWAETAAQDHGAVVFLGDSITQGWNSLAKDFPGMKVANRGIGGDTTRGVLYRLNADVLSLQPKAIVLLIGTNDLGNGANPDDVADNIQAILKAIRNYNPSLPVIVCKVMPRGTSTEHYEEKIKKLNSKVESFVKTYSNMYECDTWSPFAETDGTPKPEDFHSDRLHLNPNGYIVWATALKPIFSDIDLKF